MAGGSDWMSLGEWVVALRGLHEQARRGELPREELSRYLDERETLAKAILAAQRLRAAPGGRGRQALRVARELRIDLTVDRVTTQQKTLDIGVGGFAVQTAAGPRVGTRAAFTLELEEGRSVSGNARVVNLQKQRNGRYRVAYRFEDLPPEDQDKLSLAVFDAALAGIDPTESER